MYSKVNFKEEILKLINREGYDPVIVAQLAYNIFIKYQKEIDNDLYEKLLDIANMEMGPEFEMKEDELKKFLDEM